MRKHLLHLTAEFHKTNSDIDGQFRNGKAPLYSQINLTIHAQGDPMRCKFLQTIIYSKLEAWNQIEHSKFIYLFIYLLFILFIYLFLCCLSVSNIIYRN